MVEQKEELELVGTKINPLRDAQLQPASDLFFQFRTREYPVIGHHLRLPVTISQVFHQFKLVPQTLLDLIAQHPQII